MQCKPPILPRFIVLEGLDGAGTTTQSQLLHLRLEQSGEAALWTSEPTTSAIGCLIRKALTGSPAIEQLTFALLYAADRSEHLYSGPSGIVERCREGWVVCDRYLFSSLAYQGTVCPLEFVAALNAHFPLPEYLFFVDVAPEECARRRLHQQRPDDLFEHLSFQRVVYQGYRQILARYADSGVRIVHIDGNANEHTVAETIWLSIAHPPR